MLALVFQTFFTGGGELLFPDITYSFYKVWAELYGIRYRTIALDGQLCIRADDYLDEAAAGCCGIIFPNPNAPTGRVMDTADIERIVAAHPDCAVVVDEAYIDFGGVSVLPLIDKYENLLVVQTFSKSRAMAGMRVGFACGSKLLIDALKDVKFSFNSYTLNRISIRAGAASMKDEEYFRECVDRIVSTREWFSQKLKDLGFEFCPSSTNFIFASHPGMRAADIFEQLKRRKIYVRYFDLPRIDNYLRITVGTDEQMSILANALEEILGTC